VSLASNENSAGLLPGLAEIIATAARDIHRYPDPAANRLLQRLSEHLDVHPDQIALGTGSVAICQQITAATCSPGDEVLRGVPDRDATGPCSIGSGAAVTGQPPRFTSHGCCDH